MPRRADRPAVHLLHVGKTGGTNLKKLLRSEGISRTADGRRIVLNGHRVSMAEVLAQNPSNEVFFFLRDPVTRFVSGFNSRLRQGAPAHSVPWNGQEQAAFSYFATPNDLAETLSSPDPMLADRALFAIESITHTKMHFARWFRDVAYLDSRLDRVLFIGLLETYDQDVSQLLGLLGHGDRSTPATHAHQAPDGSSVALSPSGERNIRSWYADDIALYEWAASHRPQVNRGAGTPTRDHSDTDPVPEPEPDTDGATGADMSADPSRN